LNHDHAAREKDHVDSFPVSEGPQNHIGIGIMRHFYLKTRNIALAAIQRVFGLLGLQLRRLRNGVSTENGEEEILRLMGADVRCIVEFGAADGRDTEVYAKRFPAAKVVAIEPVPQSFKKLEARRLTARNIVAIEAAVSDKIGETSLFISSEVDASSVLPPVATGSAFDKYTETVGKVSVRQVTLDQVCDFCSITNVDLIKMDAQGAELLALKGAERLLERESIRYIFTEVQFIRIYEDSCLFHEMWNFLASQGFYLHGLYGLSHNEHGQLCWGDAIFIHKSARPKNATRAFPGME
jgi:FkbM family methyltransferase